MPKRTDIKSILIIGAGPIVIGQACEFDYSGVQACKALREEGYRVILVNSNPATIMTDPMMADVTYVEPVTFEMVESIIAKERPDALLPTMGGQTGLNIAMMLYKAGVLKKYGVEMIGADSEAIDKAEDRKRFREAMATIGLESPKSMLVHNADEAFQALEEIGLPLIIRPAYTLGGSGGGVAYNTEEYERIYASGLAISPTTQVLVEESIIGWKEYEMEVVRDKADNCIIVCSIENVDPMGVHTGDSITVAPALTLTDKEYQIMRNASVAVLREIGVDTGGSNVQFAVNPQDGRLVIIEMNPRVSRSSALASKATGFPIAKIAAKLAIGYTLDELINDITGVTPASFEPTIDYIVTKIPRFTFEKFPDTEVILSTSMKSVGEGMAIGGSFAESLQKGLRSMETGLTGLNEVQNITSETIKSALSMPRPDRILIIAQAFRFGMSIDEIAGICKYEPWFLRQIAQIVETEEDIRTNGIPLDAPGILKLKKMGFSDKRLAILAGKSVSWIVKHRVALNVHPVFKRVDTCAAEFPSQTSYMYSCYQGDGVNIPECESSPSDCEKVAILGGGPNRIGQGIEFDYCCVHAAYALRDAGYETIMINCNPETVSTDYDTSQRLFFEPLTAEDVIEVIRVEQSRGNLRGCIVQFGGQTPLKLANSLQNAGISILGTSPESIDLAEDRKRFQTLLKKLNLRQPANAIATNKGQALKEAEKIGYPVVVRPSYVLGGRAMQVVHSSENLETYFDNLMLEKLQGLVSVEIDEDFPILLDQYLQDAIEIDVDAISDGEEIYVAGIMQHVEEAGIHSGDSACSLPPHSLCKDTVQELKRQTTLLAKGLNVIGLMNVQYAFKDENIYILEVNPRASRTVPFVAKSTGIPIAKIAARVMAGEKLSMFDLSKVSCGDHIAVKEAVFPFARFSGTDIILGPEMKSTGEVMGIDTDFAHAFAKAQLGAGVMLPREGCAFLSVKQRDKKAVVYLAKDLVDMGFSIIATLGTAQFLSDQGLKVKFVNKVLEGRPHCVDSIKNNEVQLVINTTEGARAIADSFSIRRAALVSNVPHYTTIAGARAAVDAIRAMREKPLNVTPLQDYFANTSY